MEFPLLYFADLTDLSYSTPLVDLNSSFPGDGTTGFTFLSVDWGSSDPQAEWIGQGEVPGEEQGTRRIGHIAAQISLAAQCEDGDYDTLLALYRALGDALDSFGVLVWQPEEQAEPSFIDTYPSAVPQMYRARQAEGVTFRQQLVDYNHVLTIWRHPNPRRAALTLADAVSITNATGDSVIPLDNPGTALSEARVTILAPESDANLVEVLAGLRPGDAPDLASQIAYDITSPASVHDHWKRIHQQIITPTDPREMAGSYRVQAVPTLDDDIYHLQCRWGVSSVSPQANSNDEVVLDGTVMNTYVPVEVDLGIVTLERSDVELVVEIWAWSEGDTDMGDWGQVTLIPADFTFVRATCPGFGGGRFGFERLDVSQLKVHGLTIHADNSVTLEAMGDEVDTSTYNSSNGNELAAGRHVVEFSHGHIVNNDNVKAKVGELQVWENGIKLHYSNLRSGRANITRFDQDHARRASFDATAGNDYCFQVEYTEATDADRRINFADIRHWFTPVIAANRAMILDAGSEKSYRVGNDGLRIGAVLATGLFRLPPGASNLVLRLHDIGLNGYDDAAVDFPLGELVAARQATVTVEVLPRDQHP